MTKYPFCFGSYRSQNAYSLTAKIKYEKCENDMLYTTHIVQLIANSKQIKNELDLQEKVAKNG